MRRQSAEFERRSALYARLDTQLRDRTRFFAAAALINGLFARLFSAWPRVSARGSFNFLNEVGAALEMENLCYAREVPSRRSGMILDYALVCAEQRLLQHHVRMQQTQRPLQWKFIRSQLNHLLNDRYVVSMSRWCPTGGKIARVLREVRGNIDGDLDFGTEAHRVCIGLTLIEHIHEDGC